MSGSVALLARRVFATLVWPWTLYHQGRGPTVSGPSEGGWGSWPEGALLVGEYFVGLARMDGMTLDPVMTVA